MFGGPSNPVLDFPLVSGIVSALADVALVVDDGGVLHNVFVRDESSRLKILSDSIGRIADAVLTKDSMPKLLRRLRDLRARGDSGDLAGHVWCELTHVIANGEAAPVRYSIHMLPDSEQFLMLGTDQRPLIELQQQLVSAQIAMERDYESRREVDTRFRMAMEMTHDALMFVSVATRRIIEINGVATGLLAASRAELIGLEVGSEFEGISSAHLMERSLATSTAERPQPIEVLTRRTQKRLDLHPRLFRAAGERLLIIRLEKAGDVLSVSADPLDTHLRQLYAKAVDGMVFTDREGTILSASESFLNLTDSPTLTSVKGRSLADFLVRGSIDLTVMLENAMRVGHLRVYPTRLRTDFDGQLQVEISATWITDGPNPLLALIIRDSGRVDTMREVVGPTDAGIANLMELVGSTPLKDIVSETTDIVEKLCIENAIELTRNNRVAAAEMLGLSRQSLYVKLRKFGLLSRDSD